MLTVVDPALHHGAAPPLGDAPLPAVVPLRSILMVGLINFGVSFAFAIVVALRARGLGVRSQVSLARAVLRRFLRSPTEFFVAPKDPAPAAAQPVTA